jgi:hypothetical protein
MPFTLLVVAAFLLAMAFRVRADRRTYALIAAGAVAATIYFMR